MKLEMTATEYDQMMALVELGEYSMRLPIGMGLMLPPDLQQLMENMKKAVDSESPDKELNELLGKEQHESPFQGFALQPDIRPVLTPRDIEQYLMLFRRASMTLAEITTVEAAEEIDQNVFDERVDESCSKLGHKLRQYIALSDTPPLADETAAKISKVLSQRFEANEAIDALLNEVKKSE